MKRLRYLLIVFVPLLLCINNVSAVTKDYTTFALHLMYDNGSNTYQTVFPNGYGFPNAVGPVKRVKVIGLATDSVSVPASSNYMVVTAKINLVAWMTDGYYGPPSWIYFPYNSQNGNVHVSDVSINNEYRSFENSSTNVYTTDWWCDLDNNGEFSRCRTFTYEFTFVVQNIPSTINRVGVNISYDTYLGTISTLDDQTYYETFMFFENDESNRAIIDFTHDYNTALLQQQIQLQQLELNALNNINDSIQGLNSRDQQDRDDLQNQSSDSQDSASAAASDVNSAGSSLLVIIGNFINIVTNPPPSNCVIDADMGNLDLGDIDLCQLSLPQPLQVLASLLLIGMIIPFSYSLIMTILSLLKGATQD